MTKFSTAPRRAIIANTQRKSSLRKRKYVKAIRAKKMSRLSLLECKAIHTLSELPMIKARISHIPYLKHEIIRGQARSKWSEEKKERIAQLTGEKRQLTIIYRQHASDYKRHLRENKKRKTRGIKNSKNERTYSANWNPYQIAKFLGRDVSLVYRVFKLYILHGHTSFNRVNQDRRTLLRASLPVSKRTKVPGESVGKIGSSEQPSISCVGTNRGQHDQEEIRSVAYQNSPQHRLASLSIADLEEYFRIKLSSRANPKCALLGDIFGMGKDDFDFTSQTVHWLMIRLGHYKKFRPKHEAVLKERFKFWSLDKMTWVICNTQHFKFKDQENLLAQLDKAEKKDARKFEAKKEELPSDYAYTTNLKCALLIERQIVAFSKVWQEKELDRDALDTGYKAFLKRYRSKLSKLAKLNSEESSF